MILKVACSLYWLLLASEGCLLSQELKPAPPPGIPSAAGAYYLQSSGKWIKLDPVFVDQSKIKGMNAYLQTEGLSGLSMNYVYLGISAPLQLTERRPTFYIRDVGSPADAELVQLTQRKDSRAAKAATTEVSVGNKAGFKPGEIRPITITALSDGSFAIVPVGDLKPGEYLIALGSPVIGFDFGITAAKK